MAPALETGNGLSKDRVLRLGGGLTTRRIPMGKIILSGLGNHRVVAEHPARYTNPQVVRDALRAVKARLEVESDPQRLFELKKLEGKCLKCLQNKWQHCNH